MYYIFLKAEILISKGEIHDNGHNVGVGEKDTLLFPWYDSQKQYLSPYAK